MTIQRSHDAYARKQTDALNRQNRTTGISGITP
jgi:hypothetical protein